MEIAYQCSDNANTPLQSYRFVSAERNVSQESSSLGLMQWLCLKSLGLAHLLRRDRYPWLIDLMSCFTTVSWLDMSKIEVLTTGSLCARRSARRCAEGETTRLVRIPIHVSPIITSDMLGCNLLHIAVMHCATPCSLLDSTMLGTPASSNPTSPLSCFTRFRQWVMWTSFFRNQILNMQFVWEISPLCAFPR